MAREEYRTTPAEVVEIALDIAREYRRAGLTLTLRQMYYQFVGRGHEGSSQKVYKRIGKILTSARLKGTFPIEFLEDRGRSCGTGDWDTNDDDLAAAMGECKTAVDNFPYWYLRRSRWWNQPTLVSVWVEKEALSGVFERPCSNGGVPLFACKGYPSLSALKSWHDQVWATMQAQEGEKTAVILYFGDHDPDGFEIPASALRNLKIIQGLQSEHYEIQMHRLGLNMDQIEEYNPPPFPAKETSSRFQKYLDEQDTDEAWELDALEPRVLQRLIEEGIEEHFDNEIYSENVQTINELRGELRGELHTLFGQDEDEE